MAIDFNRMRECLRTFDFHGLFVNELGWSRPTSRKAVAFDVKGEGFKRQQIARLAGLSFRGHCRQRSDSRRKNSGGRP